VCRPNLVHIRKKTSSKLFLIGLWTVSVVCMLPIIMYSNIETVVLPRQESPQQIIDNERDNHNQIIIQHKLEIFDEFLKNFTFKNENDLLLINAENKISDAVVVSDNFSLMVQQYKYCNIQWPDSNLIRMDLAFIVYGVLVSFLIPLVMIICFYVKVVFHLHLKSSLLNKQLSFKLKERRKVTFLVLLVVGICIIAYTPYWIFQIILSYYLLNQTNADAMSSSSSSSSSSSPNASELGIYKFSAQLSAIFQFFVYLNSALNPFIYAFISQIFRASFLEAFRCKYSLKNIFNEQNNYYGTTSVRIKTRTRTRTSKRSSTKNFNY
jgi:hypothetical protein